MVGDGTMKTLAKNRDNDIFASAGRLAIAEDAECRTVIVDSIIRTQRGELQFSPRRGIDYFATVFTNPRYITVWAGQVRREIQNLDWVTDIEDFTYDFDRKSGSLTWSMTVNTAFGDTVNADSAGSFMYQNGDGRMGIRWSDIVDKPEGLDDAIQRMLTLKSKVEGVGRLQPASTLTDTKTVVNAVRDGIVGD